MLNRTLVILFAIIAGLKLVNKLLSKISKKQKESYTNQYYNCGKLRMDLNSYSIFEFGCPFELSDVNKIKGIAAQSDKTSWVSG